MSARAVADLELSDRLVRHIERGDSIMFADALLDLSEAQRRALMPAFITRLRGVTAAWERSSELGPLLVAGAACLPTAAQTATWLTKRVFSPRVWDREGTVTRQIVRVLVARDLPWYADVATRVAAKLQANIERMGNWPLAATLVTSSGAPVPTHDGFVYGWIADAASDWTTALDDRLRSDAFLDLLLPRIFEVDGIGELLSISGGRVRHPAHSRLAVGAAGLASLADEGRIQRTVLLDGCLGRLARGDRPSSLRPFVDLHKALAPTLSERIERIPRYLRLLTAETPAVAALAQDALRDVDTAGALPGDTRLQAARAVLARPEKALVRAQLIWLDATLRRPSEQPGQLVAAAVAAFTHTRLDVQERAIAFVEKHSRHLGSPERDHLVTAAEGLGRELRIRLRIAVGAFNESPQPAKVETLAAVALVAAPLPPPITSGAELAAEVARLLRWDARVDPINLERVLDAIVRMSATDPATLRTCLTPLSRNVSTWQPERLTRFTLCHRLGCLVTTVVSGVTPIETRRDGLLRRLLHRDGRVLEDVRTAAGEAILGYERAAGPVRLLLARLDEVTLNILASPMPGLLATSTRSTGHVDAGALVERIAALEAAGQTPWPFDLAQALLRLPRGNDTHAMTAAAALTSPAGHQLATALAKGVCDPITTRVDVPIPDWIWHPPTYPAVLVSPAEDASAPLLRALFTVDVERDHDAFDLELWPAVLPSHREVVAAHARPELTRLIRRETRGAARVLLQLAECDGPAGSAVALAVAYGLAAKHPEDRVAAVDALLHLIATDAIDVKLVGHEIGVISVDRTVKLPRIVAALGDLAQAGAAEAVRKMAIAALPEVIGAPKVPTGTIELIELAARLTPPSGAVGIAVPGLAALAARPGTTRIVTEARRLRRALAHADPAI